MTGVTRPTPFDIVFGSVAEERFPALQRSLSQTGRDPRDVEAFALDREVVLLLRDLVPEEEPGEAIPEHLALLQHAFLFWVEGKWRFTLGPGPAAALLAAVPEAASATGAPAAYYVQFPPRFLWAELVPGQPHEPLDGLFVSRAGEHQWLVMGIFGIHHDRAGFSVAHAIGPRPLLAVREDGAPLFASLLPGGAAAGLHSLAGPPELIELGARSAPLVAGAAAGHRMSPAEGIVIG